MKCSSRRNCDLDIRNGMAGPCCLNEVQVPKELRPFNLPDIRGQVVPQ